MPVGFAVNLKDIAREAGVSISTVSRVIKGKGEIAPETRERIMAISRQMGYRENRFSKAIRTGKTGLVGVLMDYTDPFFGKIAKSIEETLRQNDFLPILLHCSREEAQELFHRLVEQRVDGMILIAPFDTAGNDFFQELSRCGIPIVAMDREIPTDVRSGDPVLREVAHWRGGMAFPHHDYGIRRNPGTVATLCLRNGKERHRG